MLTQNTKAILLLTSFFNSNEVKEYKPLTVNEYGYFACWLNQNGYQPVDLLDETKFNDIWSNWEQPFKHEKAKSKVNFSRLDNTIANLTRDRVKNLLKRGTSLSLALEKWQRAGIWILDRQNALYPKNLKKHLKHQSPAILFGVGNLELLSKESVGFVGSRNCDFLDEEATSKYVEKINKLNYQVVSGGAKGVDTCAMLASLSKGNTAVGVLADNLYKSSANNHWRQYLKSNKLLLLSPFFPEARFSTANAMARNKLIYLLSIATIVISSDEKGGTWEGAKENLKKNWVPLLVSRHKKPIQAGNKALLAAKDSANSFPISLEIDTSELASLIQLKPQNSISGISQLSLDNLI
jgi:predicted Rossmann fold nucleotide-binding protein DprA/Smf involved in DNA uptake